MGAKGPGGCRGEAVIKQFGPLSLAAPGAGHSGCAALDWAPLLPPNTHQDGHHVLNQHCSHLAFFSSRGF